MGVPVWRRVGGARARGCDEGAQGDGQGAQCDEQARHTACVLCVAG